MKSTSGNFDVDTTIYPFLYNNLLTPTETVKCKLSLQNHIGDNHNYLIRCDYYLHKGQLFLKILCTTLKCVSTSIKVHV